MGHSGSALPRAALTRRPQTTLRASYADAADVAFNLQREERSRLPLH